MSSVLSATYLNRDEAFASWGVAQTTYQVDFWTHPRDKLPDTLPELVGYKQDAYLVTGATDVEEVMSWARENAAGRSFVVYTVVPDPGRGRGRGLIHLSGTDPTIPA